MTLPNWGVEKQRYVPLEAPLRMTLPNWGSEDSVGEWHDREKMQTNYLLSASLPLLLGHSRLL